MERSNKKGAFQGAVVFPGGVVETTDHSDNWAEFLGLRGLTRLQVLRLGAIRELFEETGILLSEPAADLSRERARDLRARVQADGEDFLAVCRELGVRPDLNALTFVHHWVTPIQAPARFDTHFFLAIRQSAQGAEADGGETVRVAWLPPSRFLELFQEQEISFLPPQFYLLSTLAGSPSLGAVAQLRDAVREEAVHPWQPHTLSKEMGGPAMCYPGDASYPKDLGSSPLVVSPSAADRHRLYMRPMQKKEGGAGGRGVIGGAVVTYELERTVPVPFGGESWASARRGSARL